MKNTKFIYRKAGFNENSVAEYIGKYLSPKKCFNFGWGSLDPKLILNPVPTPKYDNKIIGSYNDPKGQPFLIEQVTDFIKNKSGKIIPEDQILLTNGATNAIFLLTHYFTHIRGIDSVLAQNPTYDTVLNVFRSQGVRIVSIDPSCSNLPDIHNSFAYLIFKFQNPTGLTINKLAKDKIIKELTTQGNYVIEDDAYGLLENNGTIEINTNPLCIYIGSFSKYIFPGLRLGYIIASPIIIQDLQAIQKYYNSHPNIISQYILSEYLKNNTVDEEINHKVSLISSKRHEFEEHISDNIRKRIETSSGGFYYWLKFSPKTSAITVFKELLTYGVITIPGDIYFSDKTYPALRLSISSIDKDQIRDGCQIINEVLKKYV